MGGSTARAVPHLRADIPKASSGRSLLPICFQLPTQKAPLEAAGRFGVVISAGWWLRGLDLNQRPSGYEPDELPDCSTPRHRVRRRLETPKGPPQWGGPLTCEWVFPAHPPAAMPGGVLLFQRLSVSTIGAVRFHGRVRDGIGWGTDAMTTKQ